MLTSLCPRPVVIVGLLFVLAGWPIARLGAKDLDVYDLDSLIQLSTDLFEAEIVGRGEKDKADQIECKVTLVHKGTLKKGQTVIVAGTSIYTKLKADDANPQPLAVGDRLVLFGQPTTDAAIRAPAPGGMRLVQKDQVYSFSQWGNPGPYAADLPGFNPLRKPASLESFRKSVEKSLRDTPEWARLINAEKPDVQRLLKLLAERSRQAAPLADERDYFAEHACRLIAERGNPELLEKALGVAHGYRGISALRRGFGTTEGREYLLAKVLDAQKPAADRILYVQAMFEAGTDGGNNHYLARVAKAARANDKHEDLCIHLVRCVESFGQGAAQSKTPALMGDMHTAFAVLKELYDTKPSQPLQFAIEKATASDQGDYEKLKSPSGKIISIVRGAHAFQSTKPDTRSLMFEYECMTVLMEREAEVQPAVVLVHQGTQKRHVLPSGLKIRGGWSTGGGSAIVDLPPGLPRGRYHVFLQVTDGDKVISTGHYFVADL
jgi:hypothetical protein